LGFFSPTCKFVNSSPIQIQPNLEIAVISTISEVINWIQFTRSKNSPGSWFN